MMERIADIQQHIRKRLSEIDDLKERKAARELLLEGLLPVFHLMEQRYLDLEHQIRREIEIPNEKYAVYMTVIRKEDYDPINGTLYPVSSERTEQKKERETQKKRPYLIYFSGNFSDRTAFEETGEFQGLDEKGTSHAVKIRKAECFQQALSDLYQMFVYNRIGWTTVNTAYMDRFYEVYTEPETQMDRLNLDFGKFNHQIQNDMLLLWNIEQFTFQCTKFMVPCIDEKYYEHELDLNSYDSDSGYMIGVNEDVLKVRYEKDKIILTSLQESFRDWNACRFIGKVDTSSQGYTYELLSNARTSSFFQDYREHQQAPFNSRTELFALVQSFQNNPYVHLERCEVSEQKPQPYLEGDMNPFLGTTVFPMETRKILALYFRKKGNGMDFCEDMVRFFVSQIQLSVREYKCVGILS